MRQLSTHELQQTSGGLSSADIMGFIRGLFGSKDSSPKQPWTPPVTPPSNGGNMGAVIGVIAVGTFAALAFGLSKLLDNSSK